MFRVALIGRANVGKTTIFNRIVGKKQASIVADINGTTRDRNEVISDFLDIKAKFIDCAGIELQGKKDTISKQMLEQAMESVKTADVCLFVIDGVVGVIDADIEVLNLLRRYNKKTILIINKAENPNNLDTTDLYKVNVEDKIFISATNNLGFGDLYNTLKIEYDLWKTTNNNNIHDDLKESEGAIQDHKIRIAILGRPNAGKSTFLNNLLGENRLITSDIAGTTRDKIELDFTYKYKNKATKQIENKEFVLIDTAGIRKKHKNGDFLEIASVDKSLEALQFADVAIMIMDITCALEEQDLSLCQKICNEGRILVIVFNKWDLMQAKHQENIIESAKMTIQKSIAQVKGIVFFTCSAIQDNNLHSMLDEIVCLYDKWNTKIGAGKFNKAIEQASKTPNNIISQLKIKYINQIKTRPPTFVAFSGKKEKDISKTQVETLKNWIYKEFDFVGVPLRVSVRGKK